jgi:DNA-binding MarR family transcriptional regulator
MLNRPGQARPSRRKSTVPAAEAMAAQADAARVDYGRLDDSLGYVLRRAQLAVFKTFQGMFKSLDITPAQCSVLLIIEKNPGLTQTQVSDALGIKRANFVALFDTLEARGLAQRAPATDRRSYALQLTPRGRTLLRKIHSISDLHEEKISSPLTKQERADLFRMLNLLVTPLEQGDDDGA